LVDFFKDQPMDFAPGERMSYSNSGYHLLGAIIEKASGQSYEDFIQHRIFDSLGMKNSCYDHTERVIPRRVAGYDKGPDGYTNAAYLSMTQPYSAGSLASSVDDLARWDAALDTGQLLKPETLRQAFAAHKLPNGSPTEFGYGWVIGEIAGHAKIAAAGGIHGFLSAAFRLPEDRAYVAILSNNTAADPNLLAVRIIGWLIGQPFTVPAPIELAAEVLARYAGDYESADIGKWSVVFEDGQLNARPGEGPLMALVPFSSNEFFFKDRDLIHVTFISGADGAITSFELSGPLGKTLLVSRV
jgi:CubicO group peptidase (beta-lactamase class C family)